MLVEHFMGKKECNDFEELRKVLEKKTDKGVNEFIIQTDEPFPFIIMSVKEEYAFLSYFQEEDDPGYSSLNTKPFLNGDGVSVFYTNTEDEEIYVANYHIIKIEEAVSAIREFFETKKLPNCIEWEKL